MNTLNNVAVTILRYTGCLFLFFAISNILWVATFLVLFRLGAPEWFIQLTAQSVAQGAIAVPIWIIGGLLFISFSRRLAKFLIKPCEQLFEEKNQ